MKMADHIKITEEDIKNAESYMPIAIKENITRALAICCIEQNKNEYGDELQPIPPTFRERRWLRSQVVMGVLAEYYFKREIPHEPIQVSGEEKETFMAFTMRQDEYDIWAESHVMNQLERMKTSRTEGIRDKVFDILYDVKGFENMLFGAIRDELEAMNDPVGRFSRAMSQQMSADTLEIMKQEAAKLTEEFAEKGRNSNGR